ncbi:unnamed protein product [Macrosiphum euphorbiae]|uniref:Uncharacterized protein n=1 Tax=Macrosiphum euphorbiae TaxID=13131 RepID=A0AAV0VVZ3_9HEMI|nr:unnamed protein product [Macrosiphum euphorbiae]
MKMVGKIKYCRRITGSGSHDPALVVSVQRSTAASIIPAVVRNASRRTRAAAIQSVAPSTVRTKTSVAASRPPSSF